jgi:hypothetical protein
MAEDAFNFPRVHIRSTVPDGKALRKHVSPVERWDIDFPYVDVMLLSKHRSIHAFLGSCLCGHGAMLLTSTVSCCRPDVVAWSAIGPASPATLRNQTAATAPV